MSLVAPLLLALAAAQTTRPPAIASHIAPNGLTVLVVESHSAPLVTIEIAAKNGSMTEPPDYNGLSHLYEHMFFKANAKLPSQEAWLARSRELGTVWNGTTNTEVVNYYVTTTSDHTDGALEFMRDAIVSPLFDPQELERERVVVTGEIDRNEANPYYHFFHAVQQRVWWKHPSRKDPLGRRETVLKATPQQMRTIQQRYYVPNNSVLAVTGDVESARIFSQIDALFKDWRRGEDPFVKHPLVTHPPLSRSEVVVVEQPVQTVVGEFVWHGPSTEGPSLADTYAADLFSTALAEPSSKFQKALVDSGACVSASLGWYTQRNTGPITLMFEATVDHADQCLRAIQAELGRFSDPSYLSPADRRRAAFTLEVGLVRERERPSQLAHTLTFWWASASIDYYLGYVDQLYRVDAAAIGRYVTGYLDNKPYVFGIMLAPEVKAQGLDRAHFESLLGITPGVR